MDPNTRALIMGASGGAAEKLYVEDVFSTWLYTGVAGAQTITNGINLSGKGGSIFFACRDTASVNKLNVHAASPQGFPDSPLLYTDSAAGVSGASFRVSSFNSTGFTLANEDGSFLCNYPGKIYVSWTFRKAEKFFDVVTWTGSGANRTIAHNLGSVPGAIIVKRTGATSDWQVYHRSLANTEYLVLNSTAAKATGTTRWNSTTPTSTEFSLGTDATVNASGGTYVAYLFAHDEQIFGESGDQSVIKCGSYTGNGSATGPTVTLDWEPQWLLIKRTDSSGDWNLIDNMRGFTVGGADAELNPNLSAAESSGTFVTPLANGFQLNTTDTGYNASSGTYIYIAIRRPMKTPESGSSVLALSTSTGVGIMRSNTGITSDHQTINDAVILRPYRAATTAPSWVWVDQLRGIGASSSPHVNSSSTAVETTTTLVNKGTDNYLNFSGSSFPTISYTLRRAPGFFDVVAYPGVGSGVAISHNLGAAPQMIIVKNRGRAGYPFVVWTAFTGTAGAALNGTGTFSYANMTPTVTSSTITYGSVGYEFNFGSSDNYIAYLFATLTGVSKVGSYTGTGTTLSIDCGFTSGARFVLVKRTDSTGDWYVWDTARGIVSGNDPYLLLNSTAAEVTSTDYIDPLSSGFQISSTAPAAINNSGGSYIFLAIA